MWWDEHSHNTSCCLFQMPLVIGREGLHQPSMQKGPLQMVMIVHGVLHLLLVVVKQCSWDS